MTVVESLRPALLRIADRLELDVDTAQADALIAYLGLLQRWNGTYNLTSVRQPQQMLTQHVADCLAVIRPLRRQVGRGPLKLLDVGSGGGLPGVVIAMLEPLFTVDCVDSVGKKSAFVQQVASELRLRNLRSMHTRVEALRDDGYQLVASRAFASLGDFIRLTRDRLADGGIWMAMKGKPPAEDLSQLPRNVDVFHVEQLEVPDLAADRCLVWMRPIH